MNAKFIKVFPSDLKLVLQSNTFSFPGTLLHEISRKTVLSQTWERGVTAFSW